MSKLDDFQWLNIHPPPFSTLPKSSGSPNDIQKSETVPSLPHIGYISQHYVKMHKNDDLTI